ncbi:alpha/beta fold hydrolase [Hahella sp. KA22]|uniref:alpha/beta fold hydrolase n=1 Tax=Hahella sp. KA22 TaxID=1628392 RepID=UPI000FDD5BE0|nr:alpha/beta hydrolase [Hahella sp. KA22]AZZ92600.1 alpha/beta hydrolase [Hahella sp. KA22]QAY55973.1 alpha/beta fold hydrolase [Hahella sp. KA22]
MKSTYILVHAAWLGAWAWKHVADQLTAKGHTVIAPDLPGHGADQTPAKLIRLQNYVTTVLEAVDRSEQPVILVGHSFAGVTISQVAEARPEKIRGLVYLAAFLLPNDASFGDAVAGVTGSLAVENFYLSDDKTEAYVSAEKAHAAFAQDASAEAFSEAAKYMVAEPAAPLFEKLCITEERCGAIPKYYIETTEDNAVPLAAQRQMAAQGGVRRTYSMATGHCPNLTQPTEVAAYLLAIAEEL